MKSAEELVRDVLIGYLGEKEADLITHDANLRNTLGLDSCDLAWVSYDLNIDIQPENKPQTVQDLVNLVEQQNK